MTLEELQRLPDEQLIEKVAMEVMGAFRNARNGKLTMGNVPAPPHGVDDNAHRWNPLKSWDDTMEVSARMKLFLLVKVQDGNWRCGYKDGPLMPFYVEDKNPQRAICLAALLAVQS